MGASGANVSVAFNALDEVEGTLDAILVGLRMAEDTVDDFAPPS